MIRRAPPPRRGTVVVMVAVSMTTILGFVALAVDGGMLLDQRRQVQSAADAAALAGADSLYANWWGGYGKDVGGGAVTSAAVTAAANGYTNGVNQCTVEVNCPPKSGPMAGKDGHIEVVIRHQQPRYFSTLFGTGRVPVSGRAVARGRRSGIYNAIMCLDPDNSGSLNAAGGGNFAVTGSPVQVNSTSSTAMIANGNGTLSAAQGFKVGGSPGYSTPGGGSFTGTIFPNSPQVPDPLAYLPPPDPNTMVVQSRNKLQISGNNTVRLDPGVYVGGISLTGKGSVVMNPGVYYMLGGGFSWSGQGSVTAVGVMVYNETQSNSDTFSLSGSGTCTMSPPTSGPYQGVLLFQNRTSTTPVSVSGNGGMAITGTFYAAAADVTVTGNGTNDVMGAQYISANLTLNGNGAGNISWNANDTPGVRQLGLVE